MLGYQANQAQNTCLKVKLSRCCFKEAKKAKTKTLKGMVEGSKLGEFDYSGHSQMVF